MIGCMRTRVRKQPIIALYFESENELKLYNLEAEVSSGARGLLLIIYFDPSLSMLQYFV